MVSAVFHFPAESSTAAAPPAPVSPTAASPVPAMQAASATPRTPTPARDWAALSRAFWLAVLPPLCGLGPVSYTHLTLPTILLV